MSNEEKPQQEGMLQIEISPEVAQGTYANLAMIAHSTSEVIIDFVCMMPGLPKANVNPVSSWLRSMPNVCFMPCRTILISTNTTSEK